MDLSAARAVLTLFLILPACFAAYADEKGQEPVRQDAKGLDMVSDTVAAAFSKTNALLSGNLEITMPDDPGRDPDGYARNAIGQKVPKSTALRSASSLHNDEPL